MQSVAKHIVETLTQDYIFANISHTETARHGTGGPMMTSVAMLTERQTTKRFWKRYGTMLAKGLAVLKHRLSDADIRHHA